MLNSFFKTFKYLFFTSLIISQAALAQCPTLVTLPNGDRTIQINPQISALFSSNGDITMSVVDLISSEVHTQTVANLGQNSAQQVFALDLLWQNFASPAPGFAIHTKAAMIRADVGTVEHIGVIYNGGGPTFTDQYTFAILDNGTNPICFPGTLPELTIPLDLSILPVSVTKFMYSLDFSFLSAPSDVQALLLQLQNELANNAQLQTQLNTVSAERDLCQNTTVPNLNAQIAALTGQLATCQSDLGLANVNVSNLQTQLASSIQAEAACQASLTAANTNNANLQNQLDGLNNVTVPNLNAQIATLQNQLLAEQANTAAAQAQLLSCQSNSTNIQSQLDLCTNVTTVNLQSQIDNFNNVVAPGLNQQIASLQALLTATQNQLTAEQTSHAATQVSLNACNNVTVPGLQSQIDTFTNTTVPGLLTQVNTCNADLLTKDQLISNLQNQLNTGATAQVTQLQTKVTEIKDSFTPVLRHLARIRYLSRLSTNRDRSIAETAIKALKRETMSINAIKRLEKLVNTF